MPDLNAEFPKMTSSFDDFIIIPEKIEVDGDIWQTELTLKNYSEAGILYKVKCTSNARLKIDDCADIILPGNEIQVKITKKEASLEIDHLIVVYCIVGIEWMTNDASAYKCWDRVKKRQINTKNLIIPIKQK